jgi:Rhodopirellula transposase DDE domain
LKALAGLLQEDTAGDPTGRHRLWTGKRLAQITRELRSLDIAVSPRTVRRLLDQLGYALHANSKSLSTLHPQRDQQFECIARQRKRFARGSLPVISVDTKKKELVGQFKNPGQVWSLEPIAVKDHDFRSEAQGLAIPYGIYDVGANRGSVFVGTSHDTPEFAAGNVAQWWRDFGRRNYGNASQLLILADSGGSNGARVRAWKCALQERVVNRFDLEVTVCHYPTGASKWNPIEHRLFSEISKHWAGQPLDSYQTLLRLIAETKTQTGLRVKSHLAGQHFETGKKVSAKQMSQLFMVKHKVLPEWNYILYPRQNPN